MRSNLPDGPAFADIDAKLNSFQVNLPRNKSRTVQAQLSHKYPFFAMDTNYASWRPARPCFGDIDACRSLPPKLALLLLCLYKRVGEDT